MITRMIYKIITYFIHTSAYDKIKLIIIGTNVICLSVFLILGVLGHLGVRYTKIVFFKTKTFIVTERTSISIVFDLLYCQMFILYRTQQLYFTDFKYIFTLIYSKRITFVLYF